MGDRVAFASSRGTPIPIANRLYQKSANGAGADEPLLPGNPGELHTPQDWSPDGRHIVFGKVLVSRMTTSGELWALPLDGDRKPFALVQSSNARVGAARFSPDGRWLAYGTNESGTYRVVVRPFRDPSKGTWQVPGPAGSEPKWRRDGRELFYLGMDGTIVAVPVTSEGDQPQFGQPVVLFKTGLQVPATPFSFYYDVTADGQRFLVNLPVASTAPATPAGAPAPPTPITVVVNWRSALVKE
jgi:Tol biopolymer transport system component